MKIQVKHLSTHKILNFINVHKQIRTNSVFGSESIFWLIMSIEREWPFKVVLRKLEKLDGQGLIEYGTSLNFPWLTEEGEELLKQLNKEE